MFRHAVSTLSQPSSPRLSTSSISFVNIVEPTGTNTDRHNDDEADGRLLFTAVLLEVEELVRLSMVIRVNRDDYLMHRGCGWSAGPNRHTVAAEPESGW